MIPFILEDERMLSMLDSTEVMKLYVNDDINDNFPSFICRASVNNYLHALVHQDAVWKRLFETDSPEHITIVMTNEWLLQKWRLWNANRIHPEKEDKENPSSL